MRQQVSTLPTWYVYELGAYADSLGIGPVCIEKDPVQRRIFLDGGAVNLVQIYMVNSVGTKFAHK